MGVYPRKKVSGVWVKKSQVVQAGAEVNSSCGLVKRAAGGMSGTPTSLFSCLPSWGKGLNASLSSRLYHDTDETCTGRNLLSEFLLAPEGRRLSFKVLSIRMENLFHLLVLWLYNDPWLLPIYFYFLCIYSLTCSWSICFGLVLESPCFLLGTK